MPSSANKEKVVNLEAEVVVIGGGGAGLPAALTAADEGTKKVIVIEKRFAAGGDGLRCNHIFAVGSHLQKEAGVTVTADEIYRQALEWHHHDRVKPRILRTLINNTAGTIHWLESKGVEFKLLFSHMSFDPTRVTTHVEKNMPEPDSLCTLGPMFKHLRKKTKEVGIQFLFRTSGKQILRGPDGKVSGIIATGKDGTEYRIKTKSVVLCPGSFNGNKELLKKYFPQYYNENMHHDALTTNTGDGLKIAEGAGAALEDYCTLIRHGNNSFDRESVHVPAAISGIPSTIWVNKKGVRYISEQGREVSGNVLAQQPEKIGFVLYDDKLLKSVLEKPLPMKKSTRLPTSPERILSPMQYLQKFNEEGYWVKIADTWDGIAEWIGCDPKTLKATVAQYNSFCANGYDDDFAKDKQFLVPLTTPPFYAIKFTMLMIETVGPVRVNERFEVLDKNDTPIPGFFAAGVITSGWESNDYGGTPAGTALSFSITSGRIAAKGAVKYAISN